jgi:hypothetical protein
MVGVTSPTQCLFSVILRFRDIDNKGFAHLRVRGNTTPPSVSATKLFCLFRRYHHG